MDIYKNKNNKRGKVVAERYVWCKYHVQGRESQRTELCRMKDRDPLKEEGDLEDRNNEQSRNT